VTELRRTALGISSLALAAVAVAGCGSQTLDTNQADQSIQSHITALTCKGVKASCPSDIPLEKGHVTVCTATAPDGTSTSVHIVQTNDNGHVRITSHALLKTASVERTISQVASGKLSFAVKVVCPDLVAVSVGARVRCKVMDAKGASKPVTVTLSASGYDYRIG
jgi:hypothetical protein